MNVTVSPRRLQGWKEIATHLETSPRTAQRWEEYLQLPVRRETRIRGATVYALPSDLDAWWMSHRKEIEEDTRAATVDARFDRERLPPVESVLPSGIEVAGAGEVVMPRGASPGAANGAEPGVSQTVARAAVSEAQQPVRHQHHRAMRLVIGAAAAVLGLLVLVWFLIPGIGNRQSGPPTAPPGADQSRPAVYAATSGSTVLVMRIRVGSESATIETAAGAMVTVTLPSRRKVALVPMVGEVGVDLLLADVLPRNDRLEALRELSRRPLPPSGPVVIEAGEGLSVEILRTASAPRTAAGPSEPPKTCCVSCGSLTVCAGRVETSCGKCDAAK